MKRITVIASIIASSLSFSAMAEESAIYQQDHHFDFTFGLANQRADIKGFGEGDLKGVSLTISDAPNVGQFGLIGTTTITSFDEVGIEAFSLATSVGPIYKFSEYVSYYVVGGIAVNTVDFWSGYRTYSDSDVSLNIGTGFRFNLMRNLVINVGYEGANAKLHGLDIHGSTFLFGAGLTF